MVEGKDVLLEAPVDRLAKRLAALNIEQLERVVDLWGALKRETVSSLVDADHLFQTLPTDPDWDSSELLWRRTGGGSTLLSVLCRAEGHRTPRQFLRARMDELVACLDGIDNAAHKLVGAEASLTALRRRVGSAVIEARCAVYRLKSAMPSRAAEHSQPGETTIYTMNMRPRHPGFPRVARWCMRRVRDLDTRAELFEGFFLTWKQQDLLSARYWVYSQLGLMAREKAQALFERTVGRWRKVR